MNRVIEIPLQAPNLPVWRFIVLERDDYTCQKCLNKLPPEILEVHHQSKEKSLRLSVSNGQTLCISCHQQITNQSTSRVHNRKRKGFRNFVVRLLRKLGFGYPAISKLLNISWIRVHQISHGINSGCIKMDGTIYRLNKKPFQLRELPDLSKDLYE